MDLALLRSTWSTPSATLAERAFEHHAAALAAWLSHSGAEGRLTLVLSSGPLATERLVRALSTTRVDVVKAPSTPARPVHPTLAAHKGDHFNHTLHVVGGLDAGDPTDQRDALGGSAAPVATVADADAGVPPPRRTSGAPSSSRLGLGAIASPRPAHHSRRGHLATLDGQRSMLDKMATWVALVAESPATVAAIEKHAPNVWRAIQRRCLVLGPEMMDAAEPPLERSVRDRWSAEGRVAELVHHFAMTPAVAPDYLTFARFVRSGYVGFTFGAAQHPERERLAAVWAMDQIPFELADAGPATAEAVARHRADRLDGAAREAVEARLAGAPDARLAAGWPVSDHSVFAALRAVQEGAGDADSVGALRALVAVDGVGPGVRAHAELAIAGARAEEGDLDGCREALEAAVAHGERAAPEVRFDALSKLAQVYTFLHDRGRARELVDALEDLAPRLHSPFYAARMRLARGEFLAPLDAHRAKADLDLARTLFQGHGYPSWAS